MIHRSLIKQLNASSSKLGSAGALRVLPVAQTQRFFATQQNPWLSQKQKSKPESTKKLASKPEDPTELISEKFIRSTKSAGARQRPVETSGSAAVVKKFVDLLLQETPQTVAQYKQQKTQLMEIVNEGKSNQALGFSSSIEAMKKQGTQPSSLDIALDMYMRLISFERNQDLLGELFLEKGDWRTFVAEHIQRICFLLREELVHAECLVASISALANIQPQNENRYVASVIQGFLNMFALNDEERAIFSEQERLKLVTVAMDVFSKFAAQNASNLIFPLAYRAIDAFGDAEALYKDVLCFLMRAPGVLQASTLTQMLTCISQFESKFADYEIDHVMISQFFAAVWKYQEMSSLSLQSSSAAEEPQWVLARAHNHFFAIRPRRTGISADLLAVIARFSLGKALEYRGKCSNEEDIYWNSSVLYELLLHASQIHPNARKLRDQVVLLVKELLGRWKSHGKSAVSLWNTDAQRLKLQFEINEAIAKMLAAEEDQHQQLANDWKQLIDEQVKVPFVASPPPPQGVRAAAPAGDA